MFDNEEGVSRSSLTDNVLSLSIANLGKKVYCKYVHFSQEIQSIGATIGKEVLAFMEGFPISENKGEWPPQG